MAGPHDRVVDIPYDGEDASRPEDADQATAPEGWTVRWLDMGERTVNDRDRTEPACPDMGGLLLYPG
jgi:hypothetical protein